MADDPPPPRRPGRGLRGRPARCPQRRRQRRRRPRRRRAADSRACPAGAGRRPDESERRADLPPDQRAIEHRVRSEEGTRLCAEREKAERERERGSRKAERERSRHRQLDLGHERPPPTQGRGGPSRGGFGR
ncbi:hypothetical protein [Nonomuraea dietziae]|uniref:hypothetical protein n=1 Tax=Nonomuraea dietziae TaxID=65515 RepID=UPI0031DF5085